MELKYGSVCSGVEAAGLAWLPLGWKCKWLAEVEPFPCEVLMQRFGATRPLRPLEIDHGSEGDEATRRAWQKATAAMPEGGTIPNYGDFTRITPDEAVGIDVLVGGTPCFPAGTLVLTEEGYRPIEEIKCGDRVVSGDGRLCEVTCRGVKEAKTITVRTTGHPPFRATQNHPFFIAEGKRDERRKSPTYAKILLGEAEKKPIGEANDKHSYIRLLTPDECEGKIAPPHFPTIDGATEDDILELAGWYLGDGCMAFNTNGGIKSFVLTLSPAKADTFEKRFGAKFQCTRSEQNGVKRFDFHIYSLCLWLLENFGRYSHAKRIPAWLYALPPERRQRFLDGYLATDGCIRENCVQATTVSPALAYGIADLLGNTCVSLFTPAKKRLFQGERIINQRPQYTIRRNNNAGKGFPKNSQNQTFVKIRKIEDGTTEPVYNITVDGDHSYIVEGQRVANCQDCSIAGKRAGFGGQRSVLALDFVRLAYESKCKWLVWENVPGVFSSNGGADFATFLSLLVGKEIGTPKGGWPNAGFIRSGNDGRFSLAWRVLDAQYARVDGFEYAVPQRRRRVFVVGHLGDDTYPAEVLLEPEMLFGNHPPRREQIQGNPETASEGPAFGGGDLERGGARGGACGAASAGGGQGEGGRGVATDAVAFQPGAVKRLDSPHWGEGVATTLQAEAHGDNAQSVAVGVQNAQSVAAEDEADA